MTYTVTPPKLRPRRTGGSGTGDAWRVIVRNDNHNTFEGVAFARLRKASQISGRPLRVVAEALIATLDAG